MQDSVLPETDHAPSGVEPSDLPTDAVGAPRPATPGQRWRAFWRVQREHWRVILATFVLAGVAAGALGFGLLFFLRPLLPGLSLAVVGAVAAACALATLFLVSCQMALIAISAGRLQAVAQALAQLGAGEPAVRISHTGEDAIGRLGRATNRLADRLERQGQQRQQESERFYTVLEAMSDGVIILNRHGDVAIINPAAARLLRTDAAQAVRQSFVQVIRDYRVAESVAAVCPVEPRAERDRRDQPWLLPACQHAPLSDWPRLWVLGAAPGSQPSLSAGDRAQGLREQYLPRVTHAARLDQGRSRHPARWRPG